MDRTPQPHEAHRETSRDSEPRVTLVRPSRPALVLGSTQPIATVDRERVVAAGVELLRRRSGGGAVLARPSELVWVEVEMPRGDPLWDEDVGRSFHWLGRAWSATLASLGLEAEWHDGPLVRGPWSSLVCFAGLGPGEATVGGRKVVGLSQRRTRAGARFSCAALLAWDPAPLLDLLALDDRRRAEGAAELRDAAAGLPVGGDDLEEALLDELRAW